MDKEKEKILKRIKKFKESTFAKKIVIGGALLVTTLGGGKAYANGVETSENKADTIKNKKEIKAPVKSLSSEQHDEKTLKLDLSEKADTLSIREYNENSIKKADAGVKVLIAMAEDFRDESYLCASKVRTFGYGTTNIGRPVRRTDKVSKFAEITDDMDEEQRRDAILSKGMEYVSEYLAEHVYPVILDNVDRKLEPNQIAAVSSLIYNIGKGNFAKSPVLEALNNGADDEIVAQTFIYHNRSRQGVNQGLTARRAGEGLLYMDGRILSALANSWVGACYVRNINEYFKEDISTRSKFLVAAKNKKLTLKVDTETINKYIETITTKPNDGLKDMTIILPQDTVRAVKAIYTNIPREDILPIKYTSIISPSSVGQNVDTKIKIKRLKER